MTDIEAMEYEQKIAHAMTILADMIPHHSKNYDEELRAAAEAYIDWEMSGANVERPQILSHSDIDKLF